jgi:hypothetical protein
MCSNKKIEKRQEKEKKKIVQLEALSREQLLQDVLLVLSYD